MNINGKVFLIGAGPGDPDLITVKGLRMLSTADVVVFDSLANHDLLRSVRPGTEVIDASKRGDHHTMEQDEINKTIILKAKEGKTVVRLKGGDPFVFGRGGEEAEELRKAGIEVHVVPGITSAIAAPALAGIPVTHRDYASAVTIITGHERSDKGNDLDWSKLADLEGTLVILMGISNLENNIKHLIDNGKDARTPVAIVQNGSLRDQRISQWHSR